MARKTVPIGEQDIQSLTGAFTSSLDPKTILTSVAERTSQLLNATRCSVVRVDSERYPGKAFVFSSIDDPTIEGYELDLEDYPEIEHALDQNLPILVRDEPDDEIAARIRKLRRKVPFPVSLAIPLTYQAESFGVLFLRFADAGVDISREAITFCQLIAFGAAVSLHNAQKLQSLMAEVHQRENYAQQLVDANQLRMETLSAASHDLRIPLNSIIGYTDLLTEGAYGEMPREQKQVLGHVNDNAQALLQIVNTLIDYARLEEGKVPVQVSDGEVPRLVDDLRLTLDPFLHNRSVELDFQIIGKPTLFRTDWAKLKRVLINLLHNAIKFTERGTVSLEVRQDEKNVTFEVGDTGIGIDPEHLPDIFDQWQRINPEDAGDPGGLGLSIVKRYTDMIGGRVAVTSKPGEGTTFLLRIPLECPVEPAA